MIQIQSTWFPLLTATREICAKYFRSKESDFIKATQTIYFSPALPTRIDLPVLNN